MSGVAEPEAGPRQEPVAESRESLPPDGQEEEELDPRVQNELERLNIASGDINRCEKDLEAARALFKQLTDEATVTLNTFKKGREKSIGKARPYFEMRRAARKAHITAQQAAQAYESAYSRHKAAREMVSRAEAHVLGGRSNQKATGVVPGRDDLAWMEVLDEATIKVMSTEKERRASEEVHLTASAKFSECEQKVHSLHKENRRSINKAMPYFEQHAKFWLQLEKQKKRITQLQTEVATAKGHYRTALANLETISNEIHDSRLSRKVAREAVEGASSPETAPPGERTDGVGAEVNVGAVMESVTGLAIEYCTSLDSIDNLEDVDDTSNILSHLDAMSHGEAGSMTPALSCDQISGLSEDVDQDLGTATSRVVPDGASCESHPSEFASGPDGDLGEESVALSHELSSLDVNEGDVSEQATESDAPQSLADELRLAS